MIDGELLGLFLSFIYPILGAEEVITSETPVSADKKKKKKKLQQKPTLSSQSTRKGTASQNRKLSEHNHSTSASPSPIEQIKWEV